LRCYSAARPPEKKEEQEKKGAVTSFLLLSRRFVCLSLTLWAACAWNAIAALKRRQRHIRMDAATNQRRGTSSTALRAMKSSSKKNKNKRNRALPHSWKPPSFLSHCSSQRGG
jgi:hypothetical protein